VERALKIGSRVTVRVNVDHGQFIACDPQAALNIDSYDARATREGLALWGGHGGVTVFTASHWTEADVVIALSAERPAVLEAEWDHVVEGGLVIQSGRLHLYGPEDTGINEVVLDVPPGIYSMVVCGRDFDSTDAFGDDGTDSYALLLWPGSRLERRVVKDGFAWMD
jgi:hypothetical protein